MSMTAMPPRRPLTTSTTYTLAHTAQCKLKLAANRPDRNLRFVLGHAFTLDNLMLRIVEIENKSAKSEFEEATVPSTGGGEHYDCSAAKPVASEPEPTHNDGRGRRISFQDNKARPSSIGATAGVAANNPTNNNVTSSPARKRSPPPVAIPKNKYLSDEEDDDDTSSDDYDEPDSYEYNSEKKKPMVQQRKLHDAYSDDEDDALEDDDGGSLSLTRFESASARPPRLARSSSSSSEEEEDDGPVTPPQLPADVDLSDLLAGGKSEELADLYESVRRCSCHGHHEDPDKAQGVWDVPMDKSPEGKRLAVVAIAA